MNRKPLTILLAGLLLIAGACGTAAQASSASAGAQAPGYEMLQYDALPNIRIAYPKFSDNDGLNALVEAQVRRLVPLDTAGVTIDYACAVTLFNKQVASMVIWGYSNVERSAHPYNDLFTLNVDLATLRPFTLADLYDVNADFEELFFTRAAFPSDPVTSYSADTFADALAMQLSDRSFLDPFGIDSQALCFLKPDGLVLSVPAVHASGSDHFEAQLSYAEIQPYYRLSRNLWED